MVAVLLQLQLRRLQDPAEQGVVLILGANEWQRALLKSELLRICPELRTPTQVRQPNPTGNVISALVTPLTRVHISVSQEGGRSHIHVTSLSRQCTESNHQCYPTGPLFTNLDSQLSISKFWYGIHMSHDAYESG